MILVKDAARIVVLHDILKDFRQKLYLLDKGKLASLNLRITFQSNNYESLELTGHADAQFQKDCMAAMRKYYVTRIARMIQELNQLNAEVPQ